jgi:hypothetical protein
MPTRYSTATVPHAAYRQLRQHLRFVAADRPAGATRRRPDSAAHRRTDLRAPRMVKKSCGLPVIVLQEAAPSLLASHFAFAGSHPLFSGSKKQNIYFALMVSLSMVVLGERRYGALLSEHSPNKIKLDKHSSFIDHTHLSANVFRFGLLAGNLSWMALFTVSSPAPGSAVVLSVANVGPPAASSPLRVRARAGIRRRHA